MKILAAYTSTDYAAFAKNLAKETLLTVELAMQAEVSEKIHLYEYDCILLYGDLQKQDDLNLFLEITASNKNNGFILLSKEITIEQKVKAFNSGADDCLLIPYHPDELKARILAIVRRKKFNAGHQIYFANTVVDLDAKSARVWNNQVALTPKEYEILIYLIMNKTKTVSPARLADYLWGEESENKEASNLLVTHIKNLRKKLKQAKAELEIKNVYAVGYQIIEL